ncbi:MAG: C10 family peptidase, partial [Candidatus Eisenbacteria bacterium]|nr:C10 family peptidase [Candidatus Eisenbacteria bacterium]
ETAQGAPQMIRQRMKRVVDAIEAVAGPIETAREEDVLSCLESDYREAWTDLKRGGVRVGASSGVPRTRGNYQEGQVLVPASWNQVPPYNDDCPEMGCSYPSQGSYNTNALVGCVATAGSQIMHYWGWPRYGAGNPYDDTYDWEDMLDSYTWQSSPAGFYGPDGAPCTQNHIDAVAEICSEVGVAVQMAYGCDGSSAYHADMKSAYEDHYRYSPSIVIQQRRDFTADEWFQRIQTQINANLTIQYGTLRHSFVADGWQVVGGLKQYHMNYGWGGPFNAWYTLDELYQGGGGTPDDEDMLESIYPDGAIWSAFWGNYPAVSFPDRYFICDASGFAATFDAGQHLHFLPGIVVESSGESVTFQSTVASPTRLYTRGYETTGAHLQGGAIRLLPGGEVSLR